MASRVKDLRSLPLHDLIGAPLVAVVQAQAQAAKATVDFIERVGFEAGETRSSERDAGALRMAEFRYSKLDEAGRPAEFVARVPVLSLVPIPAIQVRSAKIAFAARITDAVAERAETSQTRQRLAERPSWLEPALTQLRGGLATVSGGAAGRAEGRYELTVELELEQAPVAAGLEKLLQIMDLAIGDEPPGGKR